MKTTPDGRKLGKEEKFSLELPQVHADNISQDEEWCVVEFNGEHRKIRFHDYHEIYSIPGLYEHLFYDTLRCTSPRTVCSLLEQEIEKSSFDFSDLKVLDLGAGNGMVGERLARLDVESLVGVDIIREAAEAAKRDRPDVYDDYHVADFTELSESLRGELEGEEFNCLTSVAALGFGDIPPLAFAEAYNIISTPGWVAFNIKETFLGERDTTGFSRLIRRMLRDGIMRARTRERYRHRLSITGDPLHYIAIIARKEADIPPSLVTECAS
ncbi:MAG: methyltransferase domain-containing protein [Acidobacteriota bacterium]|nr:MAG: methyltransferase domain-containing protein [Acidobacteriota bacterium]